MPKGLVRAADRVAFWVEAVEDDPPVFPPGAPPAPAPVGGPAAAPGSVDPPAAPALPKPADQPAAPSSAPLPPSPPAAGDYTVQPGDTLSGIAQGHGVPGGYGDIVKANPGPLGTQGTDIASNPNLIHPGDVLKMPGSPPASPAAPPPPAAPPTPPPPAPAAPDPAAATPPPTPAAPAFGAPGGLPGGLFNPGGLVGGGGGGALSGLLGGGLAGLLGGGLAGLLGRGMGSNPAGIGGAGPMGMSPRTTHAPYPSYAPSGQASAAGATSPRTNSPAMHTPTANPANWSHPYAADTGGSLRPETQGVLTNLQRQFPHLADVGGYRHPDGFNEHSSGSALDVMLHGTDGNTVKDWALRQPGVDYVLFNRRQWNPDGSSSLMPDRGSPTENHMDHTHIHVARAGSVQDLEAQIAKLAAEDQGINSDDYLQQKYVTKPSDPDDAPVSESPAGATPAISKSKKFLQPAKQLNNLLTQLPAPDAQGAAALPAQAHQLPSFTNKYPAFAQTYFKPQYQDMLQSHLGDENYQKLLHHMSPQHHQQLTQHTQQPAPNSKKWSVPANQLKKILDDPHTETSHVTDWLQGQGAPFAKSYLKPGYDDALKSHLGEQKYHELQQHLNAPQAPTPPSASDSQHQQHIEQLMAEQGQGFQQVEKSQGLGDKIKAVTPTLPASLQKAYNSNDDFGKQQLPGWIENLTKAGKGDLAQVLQRIHDEHFAQPE
jgi:hypothetical protein